MVKPSASSPASESSGFETGNGPELTESERVRCLTGKEAARKLGLSHRTLQKWRTSERAAGEGERYGPKWVQISPRRVVYYLPDLIEYIAAKRDGREWAW